MRTSARGERGQSTVEFALSLIPLLMTFLGVLEFGFAMQSWVTTQHAAREGARVAITGADSSGTSPASDADRLIAIDAAVRVGSTGLRAVGASNSVPGDLTDSIRSWSNVFFTGSATESDPGTACNAIEVEVQYVHRLFTPIFSQIAPSVTMVAKERMINEQYSSCGS